MKISELGKEIGVDNKKIIDFLQSIGFEAKSGTKNLDASTERRVRDKFSAKKSAPAKPSGISMPGISMPKIKAVAIPGGIVRAADKVKAAETPEEDKPEASKPSAKEPAEETKPAEEKKPAEEEKPAEEKKSADAKKPAPVKKTVDPSKLPSKLRPAKDRIPDDELAEKKKEESEEKSKEEPAEKVSAPKEDTEKKEGEAVRSLRAKLVKGKVNPKDIQVSRRGRTESSDSRRRDFKSGKDANSPVSGRKERGQAAPSPLQSQDQRGRKGKGRNSKGDKFDKFDRLENENAVAKAAKAAKAKPAEEEIKVITIPENISIKDLAAKMKVAPSVLIKQLFLKGEVYTVNDVVDFETAESIAIESEIICEHEIVVDRIAELLKEEDDPEETLVKRPPVVCVMGHVDHGKTSLLDVIRKTNVISKEAGGITQAIGAYTVELNGEKITFLDTPGHEAFTAMRMRGAKSTDVAILVVAADDGVMPQTIEAINHAKAADIHVIVAVNKIDKPGANIDKVKQELSNYDLTPEDWGGNTIFVPISAKTGENIEQLLEMVILDTEILELKANPNRKARGVVIEAKLDKGRGSVATLLVQKGTLKVGDHIAMGEAYGKVRAMTNDKGIKVKEAGPSTPIEITGLSAVPNAGDTFVAFDTDKEAKEFAAVYIEENKKKLLKGTKSKMSLDDVFDQMKAGELKNLDIILKADVQGSVEALKDSLEKLSNDEVVVRIIHSGVGNVNESDAILASASNAIIIAFNVVPDAVAKDTIEHEKVDLRKYNVIYNAIDDVEHAMKGMLEPIYEEVITGHAEVRQTFKASQIGIIAGCFVNDGVVKRDSKARLLRDEEVLFDGKIASLKRFADDAKEVKSGFECGIVLDGFSDIKEGDTMEFYEMKEVARS